MSTHRTKGCISVDLFVQSQIYLIILNNDRFIFIYLAILHTIILLSDQLSWCMKEFLADLVLLTLDLNNLSIYSSGFIILHEENQIILQNNFYFYPAISSITFIHW